MGQLNVFGSDFTGQELVTTAITMAPFLLLAIYLLARADARREDSASHGDPQLGIKVVLHVFAFVGTMIAAAGLVMFLSFIFGKIKGGASSDLIKGGIGYMIAGAAVVFVTVGLLMPRTNFKEIDRITRLTIGAIGAIAGLIVISSFSGFLHGILTGRSWGGNHPLFANCLVFGGLGYLALMRFGQMSGWTAPMPKVQPVGMPGAPDGYPPAQGYPPPGQPPHGAMPPQAGAPGAPQQGGYPPPQQSGYPPPQQGGYPPPQQSGYPPSQQAGGYPPPGGAPPPAGGHPAGGNYPAPGPGGNLPPPSGGFRPPGGGSGGGNY